MKILVHPNVTIQLTHIVMVRRHKDWLGRYSIKVTLVAGKTVHFSCESKEEQEEGFITMSAMLAARMS